MFWVRFLVLVAVCLSTAKTDLIRLGSKIVDSGFFVTSVGIYLPIAETYELSYSNNLESLVYTAPPTQPLCYAYSYHGQFYGSGKLNTDDESYYQQGNSFCAAFDGYNVGGRSGVAQAGFYSLYFNHSQSVGNATAIRSDYFSILTSGPIQIVSATGPFQFTLTPEPATWLLLASGCVVGLILKRQKRTRLT